MKKIKQKKKSLVEFRWGEKRSPSKILRVSPEVRAIVDRIKDSDRRRWVDAVIKDAWSHLAYDPVFA